jgi:uncharacterized coiled-coil DUF342 family protein
MIDHYHNRRSPAETSWQQIQATLESATENRQHRIERQLEEVVNELEENQGRQQDNIDAIKDDIQYHTELLNKIGSDTAERPEIRERIQSLRRELREERRRRFKDLTKEKRELEREVEKLGDTEFL